MSARRKPAEPKAPVRTPASREAFGSIGKRVAALEMLCLTIEQCRCDACFHLAIVARARIAALSMWL